MIELKSEDTFEVTGRGTIKTLRFPEGVTEHDVYQKEIMIDGELYYVSAVEWFQKLLDCKPSLRGDNVGLVVRKVK